MITPEDVLNFASGLMSTQPASEIQCRQASARAYYSVLLLGADRAKITHTKGASSHQQVYDELFALNQKGLLENYYQRVLDYWTTLRDIRTKADYRIKENFNPNDAVRSIKLATIVFENVKNKTTI